MTTLNAFVHTMRFEADDVISIELRPVRGGEPFPAFDAGAHIDLHLPNGMVRNDPTLQEDVESHSAPRERQAAVLLQAGQELEIDA